MSKRLPAKRGRAPRPSGGLSPATLALLIAFGAIGGLKGIAEIISAVSTMIEVASKHCTDDTVVKAANSGGGR